MTISNHSDFETTRGRAVTTIDDLTVGRWYQASLSDGFDTRIIYVQLTEKREDMQMLIFKPCGEDEIHTFLGSDLWVNYSCLNTYEIHKFKQHPDLAISKRVKETADAADLLFRIERDIAAKRIEVEEKRRAYYKADEELDNLMDAQSHARQNIRAITKV